MVQSGRSNCLPDFDQVLLDLKAFSSVTPAARPAPRQPSPQDSLNPVKQVSMNSCSIPYDNAIAYVAGYLMRKTKLNSCQNCKFSLSEPPHDTAYTFITQKSYRDDCLLFPTQAVIIFCHLLENKFHSNIQSVLHTSGILMKLYNKSLCCIEDANIITCGNQECMFKVKKCVALYSKVRLHHEISMNNTILKEKSKGEKRNRKLMKLTHV